MASVVAAYAIHKHEAIVPRRRRLSRTLARSRTNTAALLTITSVMILTTGVDLPEVFIERPGVLL
jgi:superfamily II DNA or RNA helicase